MSYNEEEELKIDEPEEGVELDLDDALLEEEEILEDDEDLFDEEDELDEEDEEDGAPEGFLGSDEDY